MNQRDVSRLFWAVKALLTGILVYVVVAVVISPLYLGRALKPRPARGEEPIPDMHPLEPGSQSPADLSTILETDLFGGAAPPQMQTRRTDLGDTLMSAEQELGLRLIGAIAGQSTASRAVIQNTATGIALPYQIGDVVASATIESIEADRVLLRHQGRRKALRLQSGAVSEQERPEEISMPDATKPQVSVPAESPARPSLPGTSYLEDVLHKAKIEPYVRNGRIQGLKITGLEDASVTALLGLRNGDIVQKVNGQSLTNKQKAFQVLQKAKAQPKLQIQLLRDGKTQELSFDLQ